MTRRNALLLGVVAIIAGAVWWLRADGEGGSDHIVQVSVPPLSDVEKQGEAAFNRFCKTCHGANAGGSPQGPPLVHRIYAPGLHADGAFRLARSRGVSAHHWRFGDMPRVEGVSDGELETIIAYVRALQRANAIR